MGLAIGPFWATEVFLNAGTGYHSNDLRGATIAVAQTTAPGLDSRLAFFVLTLGSEILFVGDAGTTEASRPSRRIGIEWTNRWHVRPWLALDVAATRARFTDADPAGLYIPGAPSAVAFASAVFGEGPGWFGTMRLRHFGARPLVEDNTARSRATTLATAQIGYLFENGLRLQLDAFNLLIELA